MNEKKAAAAAHEQAAAAAEPRAPSAPQPPTEETRRLDQTIPGGKYLYTDGKTLVNCWNQPIDENGKVLDENPLPRG